MVESDFLLNKKCETNLSSTWQCPSNIALVKYWGKRKEQIPENPSISFTLSKSVTTTKVSFAKRKSFDSKYSFSFAFDNLPNPKFIPKIEHFLERIEKYVPYISAHHITINSSNTFPHSSGIASSASAFAALALGILSIENECCELKEDYFTKKASFLARLGSGSACRSLEGPIVSWGKMKEISHSSNLFGSKLTQTTHPVFENYRDIILIIKKGVKKVSSTAGHQLMKNNPFSAVRFEQAKQHCALLLNHLRTGDLEGFMELVELEALTLHALMMTSTPSYILMESNTLETIKKVRDFRRTTQTPLCFTLDAGANVHLLFPNSHSQKVEEFVEHELKNLCENGIYISDITGNGMFQVD